MPCIIEYEYMMEAEFYESKAEEAMKWLELFVFIQITLVLSVSVACYIAL